jgi:protein-S-isoprenylcysteine O-methyltransferase Ste14
MNYIPIFELPLLILLVLMRSAMLGRHSIKVIVFGATDKTDYVIIPIVLFFFHGIVSTVFDLPFPNILKDKFWEINALNICAIVICSVSLIWFGVTLKVFGKSFRVGIDENTNEKLIINGTFSISRNPVYLAFIAFFTGIFLSYPAVISSVFLALIIITIHRQILREEKFLKKHYGKEYEEYCNKVRRYI